MSFIGPEYRVQIFDFAPTTFGIGTLLAELHLAKNIGYGDNLNGVPEAFFTLDQDDPKLPLVRSYLGKSHVRILRDGAIVWTGWFGLEKDSTERDVIFTCYGYLAGTYWANSDWNVQYTNAQIDTIVSAAWTRAKTGIASSAINFVTTGTVEAPVTTSGGATAIVLPKYSQFYKRILFVFQEMAALAISDTTNSVVFEITHATAPAFNFWKNRGVVKADVVWRYGDEIVKGFHEYEMPVYRRNDVLAVGSAPNNALLRYEWLASSDIAVYGNRQEPLYLQWVRDQLELQRVTALRGALAQRTSIDLSLSFAPNSIVPPYGTGAGFRMSDQAKVIIDRGATNINANYLIVGYRILFLRGNEYVRVLLQQPAGV